MSFGICAEANDTKFASTPSEVAGTGVLMRRVGKREADAMQKRESYLYVGMDLHKKTHTAVLVNCWNEKIETLVIENKPAEFEKLAKRVNKAASGNVYGFVKGSRPGSIFNTVEYQALQKNPYITNIFTELFK